MTAHQRRPGFRLPWSSEGEQGDPAAGDGDARGADRDAAADATGQAPATERPDAVARAADAGQPPDAVASAGAASSASTQAAGEPPAGFLGDLIAAMRHVAEEARNSTLADLRARAEEAVSARQAKADGRRDELRSRAETDVASVGEWAKTEAERIKAEAEQRVAARRAELERQIAAEDSRYEADAEEIRGRVAAYENELVAFHERLSTISDPAAFAAAAKTMPPPPALDSGQRTADQPAPQAAQAPAEPEPTPEVAAEPTPEAPAEPEAQPEAAAEPEATPEAEASQEEAAPNNGSEPANPVAEMPGAGIPESSLVPVEPQSRPAAPERETLAEPVATEIVVKGLGSFGAITGFRQQLAGVEGVDAVGLSLGTSGEFVFRATHRPTLDMAAAITALEGEGVEIEPRPEGGLRVTLGRPR